MTAHETVSCLVVVFRIVSFSSWSVCWFRSAIYALVQCSSSSLVLNASYSLPYICLSSFHRAVCTFAERSVRSALSVTPSVCLCYSLGSQRAAVNIPCHHLLQSIADALVTAPFSLVFTSLPCLLLDLVCPVTCPYCSLPVLCIYCFPFISLRFLRAVPLFSDLSTCL